MKLTKILTIACLTSALAIPTLNSYGHGQCNTFFGTKCDGAPRWASSSRLYSWGALAAFQGTGYQCWPYHQAAEVNKSWGRQWTKYTENIGCQKAGWVKRRIQARGNEFSPLVNELIEEMIEGTTQTVSEDTPNVEMSDVIEKAVEWDEQARTVTVVGINANCKVRIGEPVQSLIRYEIWQRDSQNDEEFDDSKVIYSTSIVVKGTTEAISGSGQLLDIPYSISHADGYRIMEIQNASVTLSIPSNANMDLLGLRLVSDGGGDEYAITAQSIIASDLKLLKNNFDLNIFPNPTTNNINISLQSPEETTAQIRIYDAMGRLAKINIKDQVLKPGVVNSLKVDSRALSEGIYYIVVQTGAAKYVKQITVMK